MSKILCLFLFGFLLVSTAYAQNRVYGRIFEDKKRVPLEGIRVENLNTHNTTLSDTGGRFSIGAHTGDYICFTGFSYLPDTVYLVNLRFMEVQLVPKQTMLKEVKVTGVEIKTGNLKAPVQITPFGGQTVVYQKDKDGNDKGGLNIKLWDANKGAADRKKEAKLEDDEKKNLAIANTFSAKNLEHYLPLKGDELDNFIILYKPDIATYYGSGFNLTAYLNASYQEFLKIPVEQRQSKTYYHLVLKNDQ